jgi:hypothetical protein
LATIAALTGVGHAAQIAAFGGLIERPEMRLT